MRLQQMQVVVRTVCLLGVWFGTRQNPAAGKTIRTQNICFKDRMDQCKVNAAEESTSLDECNQ